MKRFAAFFLSLFATAVSAGTNEPAVPADIPANPVLTQRVDQLLRRLEAATADENAIGVPVPRAGKFTFNITVARPSLLYLGPVTCTATASHTGANGASYYEAAAAPLILGGLLNTVCTVTMNYQWLKADTANKVFISTSITGAGLELLGRRDSTHNLPPIPLPASGVNTVINDLMRI